MKYNELKKVLRKAGCYPLSEEQNGHPLWYSPLTGNTFQLSHHGSKEIASGTLRIILKTAGL